MGGLKSEIVGNKAFFSLSYSEDNRSLLATGADRSIRLYDPRATEGNLVTATSPFSFARIEIFQRFKVCSLLTLGGAQRCSGLVVVQTFSCPGISFFISSSSLSDFVPSSHDHLVKMWDQRSHKTPLFELTGKKSSQCKTTLAAFSRSFTTRRNVGKHRSNPINKSDIMVCNVFTQATRTRFSAATGPAVR